jgi:Xaa-Pro aminopeptidase
MSVLAFEPHVFRGRVARLQAEMARHGLDAGLFTERANFEYLTGVSLPPLWSSFTRLLAVLVPAGDEPVLLMPSFVAPDAMAMGWRVDTYDSLERGGTELLAGFIDHGGLARARIGFERGRESRLAATFEDVAGLSERLPALRPADAMEAIWSVRAIKEPGEIDRLRIASQAAAGAFRGAFAAPVPTDATERDIGASMQAAGLAATIDSGAWVQLGWIGITSGPGGYERFVSGPRDRRLQRGDMVWADLGFTADGYWSDYCRAAVVGGPTSRQIDRQRRIAEATATGVDMVRPGVAVAEIAGAMRASSVRLGLHGLGFGRLGHGIGLTATEPPSVVEHDPTILEAGMVITCEPAAVEDDGLYCTEQIVVVGDPPEVLSVYPLELGAI